jgi:diphthamide biosynthesis methyltransferase
MIIPPKTQHVVLLVIGDPFSATTHHDLYVRCQQHDVLVEIIHNASIVNAVGMDKTVSIPFFTVPSSSSSSSSATASSESYPMGSIYEKNSIYSAKTITYVMLIKY